MTAAPPPPPVGSMQLFDSVVPGMPGGRHRVTSTVTFLPTAGADPSLTTAVHRDWIEVGGSPLHVAPTEVLSCHPPRNATGAFDTELPHVVLRRRTLPWERAGATGTPPWLALSVFADDEVTFASGTLGQLLPAGLVNAFGQDGALATDPVDVVQVLDPAVLTAVIPARDEFGLLTHVRRVNLADSALDLGDDDGWLAVVVANRLPVRPADGPGHYHACLISLEHRADLLGVPITTALVLIYRWDFITDGDGSFQALAQGLDVGTLGAASGTGDDQGRLDLDVTNRDGTSATATYRGPFTVTSAPITGADLDVSYSAATEIGRLVGAADGPVTRELVEWHRAATAAAQQSIQFAGLHAVAASVGLGPERTGEQRPHVPVAAAGLDLMLQGVAPSTPRRRVRPDRMERAGTEEGGHA